MLTCSVDEDSGWKYYWFRRTSWSSTPERIKYDKRYRTISISEGGIYHCRGGRGDPVFYTENSNTITIKKVFNKSVVTRHPNWPQIFRGETITLRCEIQDGGNIQWEYEWRTTSSEKTPENTERWVISTSESSDGDYRCRGKLKSDSFSSTEWSDAFRLVSSSEPRASLRADRRIIPAGGSVTLTCSVDYESAWKFFWFRRTSWSSTPETIKYDALSQNISISEGGIYHCRGGRGDPVFYTEYSEAIPIEKKVFNKAVVTRHPNWRQIFRGEKITLRCEIQDGGSIQWEYEWRTTSSEKPLEHTERWVISASQSSDGDYWCRGKPKSDSFSSTEWSDAITIPVTYKPKAVLTVSPSWLSPGASVTLSCQVEHSSAGWRFYWYKAVPDLSDNSYSAELLPGSSNGTEEDSYIVDGQTQTAGYASSEPGAYLTADSNIIPAGGSMTLTCSVVEGSRWKYDWFRRTSPSSTPETIENRERYRTISISEGGIYHCRGGRGDPVFYTKDSNTITIKKVFKAVVTWQPNWPQIFRGEKITLRCEIQDGGNLQWEYEWGTTSSDKTPERPERWTAGYACRAGRGDPVYYTDDSEPQFVWSGDSNSVASLTVIPDRVQHFTRGSVSLNCEGNSTEWTVMRFTEGGRSSYLSGCRKITTESTCSLDTSQLRSAVYWCESGSGEFSSAVNITVQAAGLILGSPVHPVSEGAAVSLSCIMRRQKIVSNVFFFQNEKLVQNDTRAELNISSVSKSDEGFYKCQYSGRVSPQSWLSVKAVSRPERSSFLVSLIVGLLCGIVFIILLLMLSFYRKPKESCFNRSENSNRGSTTNHGVNQDETDEYNSPLNVSPEGPPHLYDSIRHSEDTGNGAEESEDVVYSLIELQNFGNQRKRPEPKDGAVYSDVKIGAADTTLMYAQVNQKKAKGKRAKSSPAAAEAAVYSEVQFADGDVAAM
ncbi:obscurin-like [Stegastes partitus]|uniref:Obscurin-like n=1 Tax=Stegastes partitus TaxID=144197 RepID=A0A9Y4TPH2_9TELE|nr:PREDICTED: obscurin-like [Stegastes partitus]